MNSFFASTRRTWSALLAVAFASGGVLSLMVPSEAKAQQQQNCDQPGYIRDINGICVPYSFGGGGFDEPVKLNNTCLSGGEGCENELQKNVGGYARGSFAGYVSTRGRVLRAALPGPDLDEQGDSAAGAERYPVWVEIMPNEPVAFDKATNQPLPAGVEKDPSVDPSTYTLVWYDGPTKPIALAREEYEDAQVISATEYEFFRRAYGVNRPPSSRLMSREAFKSEYPQLGGFKPSTTHLLVSTDEQNGTSAPVVLMEYPFNPDGAEELNPDDRIKTLLIATKVEPGKALHESKGLIDYLTDFFSGYSADEQKELGGWCDPMDLSASVMLGGREVLYTPNQATRFERCDNRLIRDVWGAIPGAEVDSGGRWMLSRDDKIHTRSDGYFWLNYFYPRGWDGFDTVYVKLRMAAHDERAKFGNLWIERRKVQAGAQWALNDGYTPNPEDPLDRAAANTGNFALMERAGAIFDTQAARGVRVGIDMAYLVTTAELVNPWRREECRAAEGDPQSCAVMIDDVENMTSYDPGVDSEELAKNPTFESNPAVNRIQDYASDLIDRGLLTAINRKDLSNTDLYLYDVAGDGAIVYDVAAITCADGSSCENGRCQDGQQCSEGGQGYFERQGLRANETAGLQEAGPGNWILLPEELPTPAIFHPQAFVRHPGTRRLKMVLINRATGYMGSAFLAPEREALRNCDGIPELGDADPNQIRIAQQGQLRLTTLCQQPIEMRPPNLRVTAKRKRKAGQLLDRAPAGSEELTDPTEAVVGFEGAALTSDEYIDITTEWMDHDGTALPENLPGFTGRLTTLVAGKLPADAGSGAPGHFEIRPGDHTEVIRVPEDDIAEHFYLHISGTPFARCTTGCMDFSGDEGRLEGRPRVYVPFKVRVYDEAATEAALVAAAEKAHTESAAMEPVAPVYTDVYRPEFQFSIYDLEEPSDVEIVTAIDPETGQVRSGLKFTSDIKAPNDPKLPGYWSVDDSSLIWGIGYHEILALTDPHEVGNLEAIFELSPGVQTYAGITALTPADYLGLQLYTNNDPGNVLYQDFQGAFPLVIADPSPFTLYKRHHSALVGAGTQAIQDRASFLVVPFEVTSTEGAKVQLYVRDPETCEEPARDCRIALLVGEDAWRTLMPGQNPHQTIVDYEQIAEALGMQGSQARVPRDFVLELEANSSQQDLNQAVMTKNRRQRVIKKGRLVPLFSGSSVGEVMVHEVNLSDGSLRLSREDVSIMGIGPDIYFGRSYTNLASDSDGVLGPGWSHNLEYTLTPISTSEALTSATPTWIAGKRGRLVTADELAEYIDPPTGSEPQVTAVLVNGTTFTKLGSDWVPDRGRQGTLVVVDEPCDEEAPPEEQAPTCFVYTAKDGTMYRYPPPVLSRSSEVGGGEPAERTHLSLPDGLAYREGLDPTELLLNAAAPTVRATIPERLRTPAGLDFTATKAVYIVDRATRKLRFDYDNQGRLSRVTDAVGRACTLTYEPRPLANAGSADRLTRLQCLAEDPKPILVTLTYSEGRLESVTRGAISETYGYEPEREGSPFYNLVSASTAGHPTTYRYKQPGALIPSGLDGRDVLDPAEVVDVVTYPATVPDGGPAVASARLEYFPARRTVEFPAPGSPLTTYELTPAGNPKRIEEARGKVTTMAWSAFDCAGQSGRVCDEDNQVVRRTVTQSAQRTLTTDYFYDDRGNVEREVGPGPARITQSWNDFGQILSRMDFRNITESWTYDDSDGFMDSHTNGAGHRKTFTRHAGFRELPGSEFYDDEPDRVVTFDYDERGYLSLRRPAGSAGIQYRYDAHGNREWEKDALGNETQYEFDANERLLFTRLPVLEGDARPLENGKQPINQILAVTYTPAGHKWTETDRNGLTLTYSYTDRGQVHKITREGGGERELRYDLLGNVVYETDWNGNPTRHTYDELGYRETTTNREGDVLTLESDLVGNVTGLTDFGGLKTTIEYDELNREIRRTVVCTDVDCGQPVRTDYDEPAAEDGSEYTVTVYNERGYPTKTGYDGLDRPVWRRNAKGGVFKWEYDAWGNLTRTEDEEEGATRYVYDTRNLLVQVIQEGRAGGRSITTEYEHDDNGNRRVVRTWRTAGDDSTMAEVITDFDTWNRPKSVQQPNVPLARVAHDGLGNVVRTVDPKGNVREWWRNAKGWVTQYVDAEAHVAPASAFGGSCQATACYDEFDQNGNPTLITNARGYSTKIGYDKEDRITETIEAFGTADARSVRTQRDAMGNPTVVTDDKGQVVEYQYNDRHLVKYEIKPLAGHRVTYTYTATGKVETEQNEPRPYVRKFAYDALERVEDVFFPDATTRELHNEYDEVGNVTRTENRRGSVTRNEYDEFHRLEYVYRSGPGQPELAVTTNAYDDVGNVISTKDAKGNETTFVYDNRNLLRFTYLPRVGDEPLSERTEERNYDDNGNLWFVKTPVRAGEAERRTTYAYDRENRQVSLTSAGETTSYEYDLNGNQRFITRPLGQRPAGVPAVSQELVYDAFDRLERVIDEEGIEMRYVYDERDNLTEVHGPKDPNHPTVVPKVTYGYDPLNRRETLEQDDGAGNTFLTRYERYDADGNLEHLIDANGRSFTYSYDHYNRRTGATYPSTGSPFHEPVSTSWDYDDDANRVTITEHKAGAAGNRTDVTETQLDLTFDRVKSSTQRGTTVSYEYDENGNRERVETPGGITGYSYDERNRLELVTTNTAPTRIEYYPDGRVDRRIYPNGVTTTIDYWPTNRVKSIVSTGSPDLVSVAYTYDANGNRRTQNEVRGTDAEQTTFDEYDAIDRLKRYTIGGILSATYTYDRYNRATERIVEDGTTVSDKVYEYDEAERLNEVQEHVAPTYAVIYGYDSNGNTISKEKTGVPGERTELTYDSRDQLVEVARGPPGSTEVIGQYDYNADGLRVRHRHGDRGSVDYYYDGDAVIEERDGINGTLRARYHYADEALRIDDGSDPASVQYYHHDGLGTPTHLTGSDGGIAASYKVDPWGRPRETTGSSSNRKLFTGHEYDQRTGYYYSKARYYDPDSGRFLTQDSYLGEPGTPPSLHRYLYAYSNPQKYVDPSGHVPEWVDKMTRHPLFVNLADRGEALWNAPKNLGEAIADSATRVTDKYQQEGALAAIGQAANEANNASRAVLTGVGHTIADTGAAIGDLAYNCTPGAGTCDAKMASRLLDATLGVADIITTIPSGGAMAATKATLNVAKGASALEHVGMAAVRTAEVTKPAITTATRSSRAMGAVLERGVTSTGPALERLAEVSEVAAKSAKQAAKTIDDVLPNAALKPGAVVEDAFSGSVRAGRGNPSSVRAPVASRTMPAAGKAESLGSRVADMPGPASAPIHPGKLAAESAEVSEASIMRSLRAQQTPEAHATAKLIKRGEFKVQVRSTDPYGGGAAGRKPWGSNAVEVYADVSKTPTTAASVIAHEVRHGLQNITPSTYRIAHEVDAYRWQSKAFGYGWTDDYITKTLIEGNPHLYKNVPK